MTSGIANAIRNWRVNPTFGERSQSRRVLETESTSENGKFCSKWNGLDILGRPVEDATYYDIQLGCIDVEKELEREIDVERPKYFELITLNNDGLLSGVDYNPKGIPHFGIASPIAALKAEHPDDMEEGEGGSGDEVVGGEKQHVGPAASSESLVESYPTPEEWLEREMKGTILEPKTSSSSLSSSSTMALPHHHNFQQQGQGQTTFSAKSTTTSSLAAAHQRTTSHLPDAQRETTTTHQFKQSSPIKGMTSLSPSSSLAKTLSPSIQKMNTAYSAQRMTSYIYPKARSDSKMNNYAMISGM